VIFKHHLTGRDLGDNRRLRLHDMSAVDIDTSLQPAQARRTWLGASPTK